MAIGRLDEDSEGLLLLTTDGKLSHHILKEGGIEKQYFAQVQGTPSSDAVAALSTGVKISLPKGESHFARAFDVHALASAPRFPPRTKRVRDTQKKLDGTVVPVPTTWLSLTLTEGKYHQVRKMTAAVGHPTLRLVRVRVGSVGLGDMAPGDVQTWDGKIM